MTKRAGAVDDFTIHVKIKLSALWGSVMFCYISWTSPRREAT